MFSRKKRFWEKKGFYGGIATAALAAYSLSLLLVPPEDEIVNKQDLNDDTQSVVNTERFIEKEDIDKTDEIEDKGSYENNDETYYLIKEVNGLIKIYQCDAYGGENLMRTTDISYSLLYEDDQQMFSEGIEVSTEDELMEILQDFES